ncbi:transposase [Simkania negevensis]|uniref:N-acetyltransferase domain-containing protein n=1 Tax=Simkania negevensis (strain ATCC VR-1471 / DSM 27360 / Z) TaxID=331113 RepID=F8L326_SIMNZ|nr:transposase [Simkania negevensis]CCB87872.1 hypothetical protein SNE_B25130 [Simkania negevensis Z]
MSTCEKISASKQLPYFIQVNGKSKLFSHIEEYFTQDIAPLYGDQTQALEKIAKAKDRTSEILISPEFHEELGVIVYKNELTNEFLDLGFNNSFELKTLFVINSPKNSGKRIASRLLRRIAQKAVELEALSIFVTVSSAKPESLAFFLNHGFRIAEVRADAYIQQLDEYYLFNPNPQKLLSTITFELLATHRVSITNLEKTIPERFDFSPIQELILSSYLSRNSIGLISNKLEMNFGPKIDSTIIHNTIDAFINSTLKWQSPDISSEYIIVFINPFFEQQVLKKRIGYLLVGITEHGKRHILGYSPLKTHKSYWTTVFEKLKKKGLYKINIVCGPDNIHLSQKVVRLFPEIRIVKSKALKNWYPESLSPKENVYELLSEMNFINDISAGKASYSLAKTI